MVGIKSAASNSSASSSTSSVSSGVTSTVQRTRHIPISIASSKKTPASPQLRKPSPKQTTVRVQMNEFSVDFGDGTASKSSKNEEEKPKASPSLDKKSVSAEKKTPPLEKKQTSGLRRPSTSSNASNGSNGSEKKPPTFDKQTISSEKKSLSSEKKSVSSDKKSTSSDKKTPPPGERRTSNASNASDKSATSSEQKPTTSGITKRPSTNADRPVEGSPQRVVVAEIHRSADEEQPEVAREQSTEAVNDEKSHEEEYRNSQTSDSVAVDEEKQLVGSKEGSKDPATSKEVPESDVVSPEASKEVLESEVAPETSKEVADQPEPSIQAPKIIDNEVEQVILDQHNEISVDVAERKEEEGQVTTKILLDAENRAVAARDLEIEIRREIHTEVSPPVSPEPLRSSDDELDRVDKNKSEEKAIEVSPKVVEEEVEDKKVVESNLPDSKEDGQNVQKPRFEVQPVKSLKISVQPPSDSKNADAGSKNDDVQPGSKNADTESKHIAQPDFKNIDDAQPESKNIKSQSEPKQSANEDPIKPFIFKESKSATPQRYRDVAIRVESVEKEPLRQPLWQEEQEEKKEEIQAALQIKEVQQTPQNDKVQQTPESAPQIKEAQQTPEVAPQTKEVQPDQETTQKASTPLEIIELDVEKRKKSDADLAEVRVYRERYSEAPILPYPQADKNGTANKDENAAAPLARIDLANLRPRNEAETKNKRPLVVTPIEKKPSPVNSSQPSPVTQNQQSAPKQVDVAQRPRIISQEQKGPDTKSKEVDEKVERLKQEPIRLNIASSMHSPPATSPPSPSQYENKKVEKQNGTQYPSDLEINGLYKPHPLYPDKASDQTKELRPAQSTTKTTTTTTLIETKENGGELDAEKAERLVASPTLSGRLSAGTGERSDNDFTPRTLSRIKHLNVIMECGSEKDASEVIHHHPIFMRDTSKYWYKPTISREEAIAMLKDKEPGTFVVRDSNSFPGAFGLALKVSQAPAGVQPGDGTELVRHFLIEPSAKGVKLKGCSNEPVFGTLAALIYQHSITPLALPAKLLLPDGDPASTPEHSNANQALLERGAACNVTYVCSLDTESLTGPEAVRRAVFQGLQQLQQRGLRAVPVHFKVSSQGITLTDNTRTLFFRRHYPVTTVTFAGIDPESRLFDNNNAQQLPPTYIRQAPMFGFVARKSPTSPDNACHVFAELDPEQPASAVVRFITNVMLVYARAQQQQIHRAVAGV